MAFILPVVTSVVLFGSTFDLRAYQFEDYRIYDNSIVPEYAQVSDINTFSAEFFLVSTFTEFREVLGVDVATGLKALLGEFPYEFVKNYDFRRASEDPVKIVIKLSLRTVKESLPYTVPIVGNWETLKRQRIGSHYVKSAVNGADVFVVLSFLGQGEQYTDRIKKAVMSRFEKSGIFGLPFKERFEALVNELEVGYTMDVFGTIPSHNQPLNNIEDALALKDNFREIVASSANNRGPIVSYEMQSLAFVDAEVPLLEINRKIIPVLELVEMKYEDLRVAYDDYTHWRTEGAGRFIPEGRLPQEDYFYSSLINAKEAMELAVGNMDITTDGDINQFEEGLDIYGERGAIRKYRDWLKSLKQTAQF